MSKRYVDPYKRHGLLGAWVWTASCPYCDNINHILVPGEHPLPGVDTYPIETCPHHRGSDIRHMVFSLGCETEETGLYEFREGYK